MLNNNKIRLMTKLAIYENKEGKEDIRLSKYFKTDYVRYQLLKSIIYATVGYVLILVLVVIYRSEYIIKEAVVLNYRVLGSYLLAFYIIIIAIYGLASVVGYSIRYDQSRKKLGKYFKLLKRLNKIYHEETPES